MKPIRIFEAFAGYGSQSMAMKRAGLPFEVVGISEIEPNAIRAYQAVHGNVRNYGDITRIDWAQVPDFDLLTYSSPCQDFSNAGLQRGGTEGSGTRSSLLWEVRKCIEAKRPKYLLLENVKALVSAKFLPLFNQWQLVLEGYGYTNFAQVLNAKDYGVPQNRERVFLVSVLDDAARFEFPAPVKLDKCLADVLEDNVPESYYLSDERVRGLLASTLFHRARGNGFAFSPKTGADIANAITGEVCGRKTDNFIIN